ncbi:MAG: hypothetical protein IT366_20960 [Candidatus Hydrogenedentes bacterium]|nr:hypothetical protein [Candidatus Hydrogenedentota bacterium]
MKHTKHISKVHHPAKAISLLQAQQLALVFGSFATGITTLTLGLGNAFGAYSTALERSLNIWEDKKGELPAS